MSDYNQFRVDACARRLEAAHALYVRDGTFIDAADVNRWNQAMQAAIRARNESFTPADVRAWEIEKGLAG